MLAVYEVAQMRAHAKLGPEAGKAFWCQHLENKTHCRLGRFDQALQSIVVVKRMHDYILLYVSLTRNVS
jgi:hypothetical protein